MSSSSGGPETRLVFGTAALGMAYGLARADTRGPEAPSLETVQALVERALELGVTTFDTAPAYGDSEPRLGRALGPSRGAVWTKVTKGDPSASLDASLARLGRASVELLQWHNWSPDVANDGSFVGRWRALRGDPRVRRLGATTYGISDALAAVDSGLFDVVQVEFNLLNRGVVETIGARARAHGVSIAVRSVYLQGALTDEGRALPERARLRAGVDAVRRLASEHATSVTRLALRAALEHPAIDHVILGFDRPSQIDEALALASGPALAPDVVSALAALDLGGDPEADPRTWR